MQCRFRDSEIATAKSERKIERKVPAHAARPVVLNRGFRVVAVRVV